MSNAYRDALDAAHGYFSLEHGVEPRLSLSLQLVREADLGRPLSQPLARAWSPTRCWKSKTRFAPDHLWFADDIFALSAQWTAEFADAVTTTARGFRSRCSRAAT